jgi:hypothetical protein
MNVGTTLSKVKQVFAFGDSWAYGSELQEGEHPFVHWFAQAVDMPYTNYGREGSSLAMVLKTIVDNLLDISQHSIALVIIPPDVRWYSETEQAGFYTIKDWDEYVRVAGNHSTEWFTYHHAMFIYTIQKLLDDRGCQFIMAHNYGSIERIKKYSLPVDYSKFLHAQDLTSLLSEQVNSWERLFHDPEAELFTGKYFEGCIHHPNLLGHKRIAELMVEKYRAR